MKKLLLILTVLACGVGESMAQITESGKIKIYVQNNNNWENPKLYVKGIKAGSADTEIATWPGTDIKSNTITVDGDDYLYLIVDMASLGTPDKISINFNDGSSNQSYDWNDIVYDVFFSISTTIDKTEGGWNKYNLTRINKYYLYDVDSRISTKLDYVSENVYSATIDNSNLAQRNFVVAFSGDEGYNWKATIHDSGNWSKVWRPWDAYNAGLGFSNISILSNNCFKGEGSNSFKFAAGIKYEFTINTSLDGTNSKFSSSPSFTRTIGDIGYATFSADYAVAIPDGVSAYYASSADAETDKVTMTKFTNGIAASTGVMLYKESGGDVTFTPATTTDDVAATNLLKPTTGSAIYDGGKAQYILSKKTAGDASTIAFRKLTETNSSYAPAKGSAYLEVASALAPSFEIFFDDAAGGTTAIDAVKSAESAVTDGAYYNLAGQRVTNPTKGLYIVNGRKVVVK